jgi:hypothetical protein
MKTETFQFFVNPPDGSFEYIGQSTLAQGEEILNKLEASEEITGAEFLAADDQGNVHFMYTGQWDDITAHGLVVRNG